jgi:hypothetical protein
MFLAAGILRVSVELDIIFGIMVGVYMYTTELSYNTCVSGHAIV